MSKIVNDYETTRALVKRLEGTIELSQISSKEKNASAANDAKNRNVLDEETFTKVK